MEDLVKKKREGTKKKQTNETKKTTKQFKTKQNVIEGTNTGTKTETKRREKNKTCLQINRTSQVLTYYALYSCQRYTALRLVKKNKDYNLMNDSSNLSKSLQYVVFFLTLKCISSCIQTYTELHCLLVCFLACLLYCLFVCVTYSRR